MHKSTGGLTVTRQVFQRFERLKRSTNGHTAQGSLQSEDSDDWRALLTSSSCPSASALSLAQGNLWALRKRARQRPPQSFLPESDSEIRRLYSYCSYVILTEVTTLNIYQFYSVLPSFWSSRQETLALSKTHIVFRSLFKTAYHSKIRFF